MKSTGHIWGPTWTLSTPSSRARSYFPGGVGVGRFGRRRCLQCPTRILRRGLEPEWSCREAAKFLVGTIFAKASVMRAQNYSPVTIHKATLSKLRVLVYGLTSQPSTILNHSASLKTFIPTVFLLADVIPGYNISCLIALYTLPE